jgi:hypothetical protein
LEQEVLRCGCTNWRRITRYLYTLLFADYQVFITQEYEDKEFMVRKLLEEYKKWGMKINLEKTFYVGCGAETKDLI